MNRRVVFAIDLGTSAIKLLAMDRDLDVLAVERIPSSGLNVDEWVRAISRHTSSHDDAGDLAAIAVTGQMHGLIPELDDGFDEGIPWTDQRGAAVLPELNAQFGSDIVTRLGGPLASCFLGVSLAWLKRHQPDQWARTRRVMLPKDALIHALTGQHVTDPSDAAGTGLFDVARNAWAWDVVDAIGIPRAMLPEIVPSGSIAGTVTPGAAQAFGFRAGTPVIVAGGDAAAGALGGGGTQTGQALILLSTGAQVIQPSMSYAPDPDGRWYTWPAAVPAGSGLPRFLRVGTLLNAGITTTWTLEVLNGASEIAPAPSGLLMLPHLIGERTPLRDPRARGAILGIGPDTSAADIARAALEGIAFSLRHALETMTGDGPPPDTIRLGGGGAHDAVWRQIITDVLGIPTGRIDTPELSAYGAALLGAQSVGWVDLDAWAERAGAPQSISRPDPARHRRYVALYRLYRDAVDALAPICHGLAAWREARP